MKPIPLVGLIFVALLFSVAMERGSLLAEQGDRDFARLAEAKPLRCTFTTGVTALFEASRPRVEQFAADTRHVAGGTEVKATDPIYFDSIDYQAQRARLVARLGSGTVGAYASPAGVYFVDRPALGGIVLYFVFSQVFSTSAASSAEFVVVSTIHTTVPDRDFMKSKRSVPAIEQSYGTCKAWQ